MRVNLTKWAARWGVPYAALEDLRNQMGMPTDPAAFTDGLSETAVSCAVRVEASKKGKRLWRNNVGHCTDEKGNHIRYGLANDSRQLNKICKSSDLIGIQPVLIRPEMIGLTIGQFVARETKPSAWKWCGDDHEQAQLNFLNLVLALGGDAAFCTSTGTL